ncbi:MAG: NAD-dependent deacetylase [Deltaproteobacteria bacterium]|nr:MAG: NAD-dependent deacetylase [Deltaproteobacteria bacterium]
MGVDSGLPDFRGPEGFWRAYPPLARRGLRFEEMANPRWFDREPHLAWAFYGHRLRLYRQTRPHAGFQILRQLAGDRPLFVFTSNVDGAFQAAGFDDAQIYEIHGSIHILQRTDGRGRTWSADGVEVDVDMDRFVARDPLPTCPVTGQLARPNILMFNDWRWRAERSEAQAERYAAWLDRFDPEDIVIIEIGAGTAVPSVRNECSRRHLRGAGLIRINPREPDAPRSAVSLPLGALDALTRIAAR